MGISKIFGKIQNKIALSRYEKHKKELNRLVDTTGLKKHIDAYNEIALAKETIANFAKKNTVSVDIFDTSSTISRCAGATCRTSSWARGWVRAPTRSSARA